MNMKGYIKVNGKKYYKTYEEIKTLITELLKSKGKTLTEYELERTLGIYIYLIDNTIPIDAVTIRKLSE